MGVFEIICIIISVVLGTIIWSMIRSNFSFFPILSVAVLLICITIVNVILNVCGGFVVTIFNIVVQALTGGLD